MDRLRVAAAELGEQQLLFVEMMSDSVMRPIGVLRARLEHVQEDRDEIVIPRAKAGARVQPITTALARMLREMRKCRRETSGETKGWLFPSSHKKARKNEHRSFYLPMFRKMVERAGLDPQLVTLYTLRRTSITDAAATRIDVNGLPMISGHKSLTSLLRYIHTKDAEIRRTMDALERHTSTPELHTQ
jgi:integrase